MILFFNFFEKYINKKLLVCLSENFNVILPESYFKLFWDAFIFFLLFLNIFYVPYELAFNKEGDENKLERNFSLLINDVPIWVNKKTLFLCMFIVFLFLTNNNKIFRYSSLIYW